MSILKKSRLLFLALTALCAFAPAAFGAANFVSIATGGTGGTYFPIGGAIAQAVSKDGKIKATAETGNASVANVNLVSKGEIEVAFTQNDVAYWAYNGQIMFKEPAKNLRAIAALYPEHVQLIMTKDLKAKSLSDLKGKRVSVGAPGSGVEADVQAIFDVAGIKYSEMKVDRLDFAATTNRFKDNQIDAGFVVAGYPTASIMDLATSKDVTLFNFDEAFLAKLTKAHPYFVASDVPAGVYKDVPAVKTPAVMAILVTHDKVSDADVYAFTKGMFDNLSDIQASHAKGKEINLKTALDGLTVPLHPGAEKYFKEKGLIK